MYSILQKYFYTFHIHALKLNVIFCLEKDLASLYTRIQKNIKVEVSSCLSFPSVCGDSLADWLTWQYLIGIFWTFAHICKNSRIQNILKQLVTAELRIHIKETVWITNLAIKAEDSSLYVCYCVVEFFSRLYLVYGKFVCLHIQSPTEETKKVIPFLLFLYVMEKCQIQQSITEYKYKV